MIIKGVGVTPFSCQDTLGKSQSYALVKIETDEGISGYGELCDGHCCRWPMVAKAVVDSAITPLLLEENPEEVERLVKKVKGWTRRGLGNAWTLMQALSAVEIALWDIVGKARGKPVSKILGAKRDRVKLYVSSVFISNTTPEDFRDLVSPCLSRGVDAFKVRMGLTPESDLRSMSKLRDLVGRDVKLLVEGNENFTLPTARAISKKIAALDAYLFEEPILQDDLSNVAELVAASEVPIAYGEHVYALEGFAHMIKMKAADILQPDATLAGGLLEGKSIGQLIASNGLPVVPHSSCGPVGFISNLHFSAIIPEVEYLEYAPTMLDSLAPKLLREESLVATKDIEEGYIKVPDGPGLGFEIDEEFLKRHQYTPPVGAERRMSTLSLGDV